MSKSGYGPTIIDGEVQYFSATSLQNGDIEGCQRKYYYKYVEHRPEPKTAALELGTKVDDEITAYLSSGKKNKNFGPLTMTAMHLMPPDGIEYRVQEEIEGILSIQNARVVGKIDLLNLSGLNYGGTEFAEVQDPPNTIEVFDWKTTSDFKWAKEDPSKLLQMQLYGEAISQKYNPDYVRLSHGYIRTKGSRVPAKKTTKLVRREELHEPWEKIQQIGNRLIQIAKAKSVDDVPGNVRVCKAYSGCPHQAYCSIPNHDSLKQIFGEELVTMSILDKLNVPDNSLENQIAAMQAKLLEQEQATRHIPVPPPPPPPAPPNPMDFFKEAVDVIDRAVYDGKPSGWPPLGGDAAKAYAQVKGLEFKGQGFAGSGRLGGIPVLMTMEQVVSLSQELITAGYSTKTPAVAPAPVAPAPTPPPAAPAPPPVAATPVKNPLLPPDAPASNPALAAVQPAPSVLTTPPAGVPAVTNPIPLPDMPKRGPGRPPKNPLAATAVRATAAPAPAPATTVATAAPVATIPVEGIELYVNAIPSIAYQNLDLYIRALCARLEEQNKTIDIRISPNDSPLAYGKWKGVLSALVRANPPPNGVYVVLRPDEVAEVVCDTLRTLASYYVQGVSVR